MARKSQSGVLAGSKLHGLDNEFERVSAFCAQVRLPVRLADIGIMDATDERLAIIARRAYRPDEIIHNEPTPITEDMVVAALKTLI